MKLKKKKKTKSLKGINEEVYYMYANGLDTHDGKPIYREVHSDEVLDIAYKVYVKR